MFNLKMYCMCTDNSYFDVVKSLNYIPVGLKNKNFSKDWVRDNTLKNISNKNPYYGEYTFYYWYWKNNLNFKNKKTWIGFCHYRELWGKKQNQSKNNTAGSPKKFLLQKVPKIWNDYDVIIGKPLKLKRAKLSKTLKYGKTAMIKNPKNLFLKYQTIKFQFDMFHGVNNLDKAIKLLPKKEVDGFTNYVNQNTEFNQGNMFITRSSKIMHEYFKSVFPWLKRCEKVFGLNLKGYRKIRIYTYLAERYLPYWFTKYTNYLEWPVINYDLLTNEKKNKKI